MKQNKFLWLTIYFLVGVSFLCLNSVKPNLFFATSLYLGLLYGGANPFGFGVLCIASFCVCQNSLSFLFGAVQITVLGGAFALYRCKNLKPRVEIILFFILSVLPSVIWGQNLQQTLTYNAIICVFGFVFTNAINAVQSVYYRHMPNSVSVLSLAIFCIVTGIGLIKITSPQIYVGICVLVMLVSLNNLHKFTPYFICGVLASPLAITSANTVYFCTFFIWFAFIALFSGYNRFLGAICVVFSQAVCGLALNLYQNFIPTELLYVAVPALLYCCLPNQILDNLKDFLTLNPNELLSYGLINRTRTALGNRLYEISGVFFEMQQALVELNKNTLSTADLTLAISQTAINGVCKNCAFNQRCVQRDFPNVALVERFVSVGIAKGKITLIDLPREFTDLCAVPNSIIFEVNRLISEHLQELKGAKGAECGRDILSCGAFALGEALKNIAFDFSKTMCHNKDSETAVLSGMSALGYPLNAVLIVGEGDETEISVFGKEQVVAKRGFDQAIKRVCGYDIIKTALTHYNGLLVAITYKKAPNLDAIFGVSQATKYQSTASGDTHSVLKIDQNKFLIALSDGMGSGEKAKNTSVATINLLESFYKAGLDSQTILQSVNKILSLGAEDTFSAVDIAVCDLKNSTCDFIKVGAPFGLILNKNGVRFIEASSLPLGILDETSPALDTLPIEVDDVIILISDGITDAFGSASEMVEFLQTAPLKNPKELADQILAKAQTLSSAKAPDDMTCIAVRIIERCANFDK